MNPQAGVDAPSGTDTSDPRDNDAAGGSGQPEVPSEADEATSTDDEMWRGWYPL